MNRNGPTLFRLQVYIFACKATSVRGKISVIGVPGPARASFMKEITVRYVYGPLRAYWNLLVIIKGITRRPASTNDLHMGPQGQIMPSQAFE